MLADVLELGDMSWQCHYDTGCFVAESGVDEVVTVGQEMKALVQAVNEHAPQIVTHNFSENDQAAGYLKGIIKPGDALLVKGSRGMHQEEIVKALKEYFG